MWFWVYFYHCRTKCYKKYQQCLPFFHHSTPACITIITTSLINKISHSDSCFQASQTLLPQDFFCSVPIKTVMEFMEEEMLNDKLWLKNNMCNAHLLAINKCAAIGKGLNILGRGRHFMLLLGYAFPRSRNKYNLKYLLNTLTSNGDILLIKITVSWFHTCLKEQVTGQQFK